MNEIELIERVRCPICGSDDIKHLDTMKGYPVFMGCVDQPLNNDILATMTWVICKKSGTLFLKNLVPLPLLYPEQHNASVGKMWNMHHAEFARFISKYTPSKILEIGGAHGILSIAYKSLGFTIPWTIIEPNPAPSEGCDAAFIKGFFDDKFIYHEEVDTVVHSHLFEHIYDPLEFMSHLNKFMPEGKRLIFSLPNMEEMLKRKYTNCLNFEHTIFLTEEYVEYLLSLFGFRIDSKQYFMNDHSIFYSTIKDASVKESIFESGLFEKNQDLYVEFKKYHIELIQKLNSTIRESSRPVYLFGAHVFSQYLIECGLDTANIISLLDNDPKKQGKRLYGTSLLVESPAVLAKVVQPLIILKAGVYNDEIKNQIHIEINSTAEFLE